ncbi:MAG: hypothetical protein JJ895_04475 [Balneolaceae bacterium]|nr:hypothetical protein [Balneolaceae bacterium]
MSILIADAGATSTSWALIKENDHQIVRTSGLDPSLKVDAEIESVIFDELSLLLNTSQISQVIYYGAGCGDFKHANRIKKILSEAFRKAEVSVKTDIEGAGLALFAKQTGIVVISGSGSSAGFMDNGKLVDVMPSKAYPEGDFGSGAHIGALVLSDFFAGDVPSEIKNVIQARRRLSIDDLFVQFQDPIKSKLIASKALGDVISSAEFDQPLHQDYLKRLVFEAIEPLFDQLKNHFKNALAQQSIRFAGGTVGVFEEYFREYFRKKGLIIDKVEKTPIIGLIDYHSTND